MIKGELDKRRHCVILIGLMVMIGLDCYRQSEKNDAVARAKSRLEIICAALQMYRSDHTSMPSEREGLTALLRDASSHGGPYLKETLLRDPWGNSIGYSAPTDKTGAILRSSNGLSGTGEVSIQCGKPD
jgi:general secretion pathway protein G